MFGGFLISFDRLILIDRFLIITSMLAGSRTTVYQSECNTGRSVTRPTRPEPRNLKVATLGQSLTESSPAVAAAMTRTPNKGHGHWHCGPGLMVATLESPHGHRPGLSH